MDASDNPLPSFDPLTNIRQKDSEPLCYLMVKNSYCIRCNHCFFFLCPMNNRINQQRQIMLADHKKEIKLNIKSRTLRLRPYTESCQEVTVYVILTNPTPTSQML